MSASDDEFALPEAFSGRRSDLGTFLASLDECFEREPSTFSSDSAKVIFATGHLRGTALKWAMAHPDASGGTFDKFVEDLQARFGNPDPKETAFSQLKKLKQHGSARSYRDRFVKYAEQCEEKFEKDPASKNKWFYRGLKDDVKDALMTTNWEWKMAFDKLADEVIKIDEKLRPAHLNEQENRYGQDK
ncbi:hypothetical protein CcaverHIS002_0301390 [Cutaneotrichosporon cavernicola]|uniref:Retrotransposon gag domain-containing protein n=1 Tax=Cutaneotrichosporon cavernicola TaxID=279322 RepID=A0AA48L1R2_9TREE|nr:uncharacterized protein CcaverHIS019_0301350 [Cutaneotrichosporon cavernicola]BEI82271.1 hypothetical protein CcaverHIS002_0301390 [Cutaneotrichosporon cavernicola]BEI90065.1 hypothetical protein CcaverHIS019_0301350 [Cutaneotrichosporon cavernicola]BEI97839.1 hypothetical protein CcaverHIS631_0301380 [Cutaneotrichosporon cavernicola]BEJ05616.1 hypothetical protein CcaverHIS641_0301380 [Cutaneotrichosporon cavernicola]